MKMRQVLMAAVVLAALGAICDVTSLTGFNRALTAQGLKVMSGWANPGLKALMEVAQAKPGPAGEPLARRDQGLDLPPAGGDVVTCGDGGPAAQQGQDEQG